MSDLRLEGKFIPKTIKETSRALPETTLAIDNALSSSINIINTILTPFNLANIYANYALKKTRLKLMEKFKNVSPEKITNPPSYISVPTIQAISYSSDCAEIHSMFANLLASSMNTDTVQKAHPAFIEIIKQMNPLEAKILADKTFRNASEIPICSVRLQTDSFGVLRLPLPKPMSISGEGITILNRLLILKEFESTDLRLISSSIDNLIRLGIFLPVDAFITDINHYQGFLNSIERIKTELNITELENQRDNLLKNYKFSLTPYALLLTDFGRNFISSCIL